MPSDITYTFPVGGEAFVKKACHLIRSIEEFSDNPDIVTYILPNEVNNIQDRYIQFISKKSNMIVGERPISDYPVSAKLAAFKAGAQYSSRNYIAHLDTDTLLLNDIKIHQKCKENRDIYLKPVDFGNQYWGKEESFSDWEDLYKLVESEFPGKKIKSTIDNKEIPPYYNAGLVISKNSHIPERWLELTRSVFEQTGTGFSDQVALGLLSNELNVGNLSEYNSWILGPRFHCPPEVNLLRYQEYYNIPIIRNDQVRKKIASTGLTDTTEYKNKRRLYTDCVINIIKSVKRRTRGF